MEAEQLVNKYSFHHSCHGTTTLEKQLIDIYRPLKYIILKYIMNINIDKDLHLITIGERDDDYYNISINKLMDEVRKQLTNEEYDEFLIEHKEELESIPIVYPILGVPNGVDVEIHYKIRGPQCQTILTKQFTYNPGKTLFRSKNYKDYLIITAKGNSENLGIIQQIKCRKGRHFEVFYDIILYYYMCP